MWLCFWRNFLEKIGFVSHSYNLLTSNPCNHWVIRKLLYSFAIVQNNDVRDIFCCAYGIRSERTLKKNKWWNPNVVSSLFSLHHSQGHYIDSRKIIGMITYDYEPYSKPFNYRICSELNHQSNRLFMFVNIYYTFKGNSD